MAAWHRYGMDYRTIQYCQQTAWDVYRRTGIYPGRTLLEHLTQGTSARLIGRAAIGFASVASPEHLIAVMDGTRKGRWK